jgi:hypothetical protein
MSGAQAGGLIVFSNGSNNFGFGRLWAPVCSSVYIGLGESMIGSGVGEIVGASGRDVTLKETTAFKTAAVVKQ